MLRHSLRTLAVAAVAAFILGPAPAAAVTPVTTCRDLDKAGETYIVTTDITASDTCFRALADRITLDLGGHTIGGPGADISAAFGISDASVAHTLTVVKNGSVMNFGVGIGLTSSTRNTLRNVTVSGNGIGIFVGPNSLVKDCIVQRNVSTGIATFDSVQVEGCLIGGTDDNGNGGFGMFGGTRMLVTKNTVIGNGGAGIVVGANGVVTHNTANENGDTGITAGERTLVAYNTANDNTGDGIFIFAPRSTVSFNTANGNGGDGIQAECPATITFNKALGNVAKNFNPVGPGCVDQHNIFVNDPS